LFYLLLPPFLVGTAVVVGVAAFGVWSEVEHGRPYLVRQWTGDPGIEKVLVDEGREAWAALKVALGDVLGEARGAAWDSAAAQKLRERFVDEAKKEPALERLVDQLAKAYEAVVLFSERSESKADIAAVRRAVGERVRAASTKLDGAKGRALRFAKAVALYRGSQIAEYAGIASLAATLRDMVSQEKEAAPPAVATPAAGRDPLKYLSVMDKVLSGKIGVKRVLAAAICMEIVVVALLALLGFAFWVLRDALPAWLFTGRREVGLCVVDARTGEAASRRARVVRGLVAALLGPVHGAMVALGQLGVADRVAGTRVIRR
jgi:hypothetical protein